MSVDRKMSHDKHQNGHYTKALTELTDIQTSLTALKIRMETLGR
jgi:predicted  nucleic acid-binding Zn-ribbon protein